MAQVRAASSGRRDDDAVPGDGVLPVLDALRSCSLRADCSAARCWRPGAGACVPRAGRGSIGGRSLVRHSRGAAARRAGGCRRGPGSRPDAVDRGAGPGLAAGGGLAAGRLRAGVASPACPASPPAARPGAAKLEAVIRRRGSVLIVAGEWDGAQSRLHVADQDWAGIGTGHGRLRARRARVVADGRGAAARPRESGGCGCRARMAEVAVADELGPAAGAGAG